ncbi:WDGH domain-containing protein [Deinococcus ruber]|uniref:WDGH domain-containing protein n=1 Tax=Deinococcus ruber TaxID=1848197 RepID=A0A918CN13_9DEIO|nr:hypothetical protein [Deinococcus ruber]GGR31318.1 hypothetical protein GCM10008957_47500 [Deinococcus ruber]
MTTPLDAVYRERAHLTAALSKLFPASLEDHIPAEGEEWDPDWTTVLIVDLPTGQVSWHIASWDLELFAHLPRNAGRVWDGHTTPEKYARLDALEGLPRTIPLDLAQVVVSVGEGHWGATEALDAEGHGREAVENVRRTLERFGLPDEPREMHGVFTEDGRLIALSGMSPNSPQVARGLTAAWNLLRQFCQAALDAAKTQL